MNIYTYIYIYIYIHMFVMFNIGRAHPRSGGCGCSRRRRRRSSVRPGLYSQQGDRAQSASDWGEFAPERGKSLHLSTWECFSSEANKGTLTLRITP